MSDEYLGEQHLGSRGYTDQEYRAVVKVLQERHVGPANKARTEDLLSDPEIAALAHDRRSSFGRALRQIIADADGIEFVVHAGDDGVFVAENYEQTVATTRRYLAAANALHSRVGRRNAFAGEYLPRLQAALL
jgi:hypothetical protein